MVRMIFEVKRVLAAALLVLAMAFLLPLNLAFAAEADHGLEHEGAKTKQTVTDRTETKEDAQFRKALHMTYLSDSASHFGTGDLLYQPLIVTGDVLGEEQIYAVRELEELISLSFKNQKMNALALPIHNSLVVKVGEQERKLDFAGLDLVKFLTLCGVPEAAKSDIEVQFYQSGCENKLAQTLNWQELQNLGDAKAMLAVGLYNNKPLVTDTEAAGYAGCCGNAGGALKLIVPQKQGGALCVDNLGKIVISSKANGVDPRYDLHNHAPYNAEKMNKTLTVNLYQQGKPEQLLKTKSFTTWELEQLALAHPERVCINYYGTIGDQESMGSMGLDAWLDCFKGLDLWWLLENQVGLPSVKGSAVFYGREGEPYTTIKDLRYLNNRSGDYSDYKILTQEGVAIPNAMPIIAISKNGYPLLPEHDHESAAYRDYNKLNKALTALGVPCEVGVIKNHSGPFIAGLGNVQGLYGGYRVETGGDCVRIDLILDLPPVFADVKGHWAEPAITFALEQGFLQGATKTSFEPETNLTRGMLVTVLGRWAGATAKPTAVFKDVAANAYYAPYVSWAYDQKLVKGLSADIFAPEALVSREEVAVILNNLLQSRGQVFEKTAASFGDANLIADWAVEAVASLSKAKIITGDEANNFKPEAKITRAEFAEVLQRLTENTQKKGCK